MNEHISASKQCNCKSRIRVDCPTHGIEARREQFNRMTRPELASALRAASLTLLSSGGTDGYAGVNFELDPWIVIAQMLEAAAEALRNEATAPHCKTCECPEALEIIEYPLADALRLARSWREGKMIGGDQDAVIEALLREVERLNATEGGRPTAS